MKMAKTKSLTSLFSYSKTLSSISTVSSFASSPTQTPPPTPESKIQTFSESMIEETLETADSIITKWKNTETSNSPLFHKEKKAEEQEEEEEEESSTEFLRSVDQLRRAMRYLVSTDHSGSTHLVVAQKLMQIAMKCLQSEFYWILSTKLHDESGTDLKSIANCMISSGYGKECAGIYKVIRRSSFDEALYTLGIQRFKSSQIQKMEWTALEHVIKNWLASTKIAFKTIFQGERVFCDNVFSCSASVRGSCFGEVTREGALNLFKFPEMVAKRKRLVPRVFQLMEMYEAVSEMWHDIQNMFEFEFESTSKVRIQAVSSMTQLGNSIESTISEYESTIHKYSSASGMILGGGIHPMTRSVMEFLCSLTSYIEILSEILAKPLSLHVARIILVLQCKLDSKAEAYKEISLSYLFLANNLDYIVQTAAKTANLKILLGPDWITEHEKKVAQYALSFELFAWNSVFMSLPEMTEPTSSWSADVAKGWFAKFNSAFEATYAKHTSWVVPDSKLRNHMKVSIVMKLVPVYTDFHKACMEIFSSEKNFLAVLVRFSPDDIGNYLSDLFDGPYMSSEVSSTSLSLPSSSSFHSRGCLSVY